MATMIPDSVEQFTTEGERQTYQFIEAVAKPDNQLICWYLPDVQGKEPDFLLFSGKAGLVVLEVKDWNLEQIREASPHRFLIDIGGKAIPRQNPLKQARDYVSAILDKVKADGRLVSKDPFHHGNFKIPINSGVVFPNINKYEYVQKGFDKVISAEKIFFWDDLHPASDICMDPSGGCFARALKEKFPPRFAFTLSGPEMDHLKQLIFPEVKIRLPARESKFSYTKRICRLSGLDHHQEALARKFDGGHRIITGPSGCGKTLILVHKAKFLLKYNPEIKRILFVCFNITLVNYITRLLSDKDVPMGENGVQVKDFYQLCSEIMDEEIAHENEDTTYYDLVDEMTLEKVMDFGTNYDAIMIDEGQDFSDIMFKIVFALLNEKTNNLTIALYENQNIYRMRSNWKDAGIQARGRIHKIPYIYRNTEEISNFAAKFKKGAQEENERETEQGELFPDFFDFHGPKPEIKQFADFDSIAGFVARKSEEIVEKDGCPYSEIAIIYCKKAIKDQTTRFIPKLFEKSLNARGILSNWAAENYFTKRNYYVTTDRVTISTIHSTKGFDYACVFIIGLDLMEENGWSQDQIINMTYVAITRARYQLFIPFIKRNRLIGKLEHCQQYIRR